MRSLFSIILLTFLLFQNSVSAEDWKYRINQLTIENGLSQNTIDCIFKDSRGFMWFGTWNGLNRYDGYKFTVYKRSTDSTSISSNFIHSVTEDINGNLWIATRNGLNLYDYKKDRFIRFFAKGTISNSPSSNWVNIVYCDRSGNIWIGTSRGLDQIRKSPNSDEYAFIHHNINSGLRSNDIRTINEDQRGRLWIGTSDGINLFSNSSKGLIAIESEEIENSDLSSAEIRKIYQDTKGKHWIGTSQGLFCWDETSNLLFHFNRNSDNLSGISHAVINDISEDVNQKIYIATLGGVDYINPGESFFRHIPVKSGENRCLNNEFINSLYCDPSGIIWIGTEKGGINKFNVLQKEFRYYMANPEFRNSLSNNTVNSILDETDLLWVGTAGGGLNRINKRTGIISHYKFDVHQQNSLSSDFITSIIRDSQGRLWLGTWGGGFNLMLSENSNGNFQHYRNAIANEAGLVNDFISTLYLDAYGYFWIGTEGGLDLFNRNTSAFTHVRAKSKSPDFLSEVGCLLRDSKGNLWTGTRNGLFFISAENVKKIISGKIADEIVCIRNNPKDSLSLNENYVISLFEDSKGRIWVGTYGNGLNLLIDNNLISEDSKFRHLTQTNGLCNNVVYGILEDHNTMLWLSTDNGLSCFNPKDESFRNFYITDGLTSNQFYWSAASRGVDDNLYFGGMNGLNYFNPDEIIKNKQVPKPVITEFKIYNQPVKVGQKTNSRVILPDVISEMKKIKLSYRENTFSFEFSALSYELPEKNMYSYKLEGVDADWIDVPADRRFASYTKLKGGEYVFMVKASNNDGVWNDEPLKLFINISPPFWLSWWFKLILIILLLASVYIYLKLHTRSLLIQKNKLELQVQERTTKIEHQKQELILQASILQEKNSQLARRQEMIENQKIHMEKQHAEIIAQRDKLIELNKKVKAVNQLKIKFFTNISHEFKTPLTLILGPLEKLIKSWKSEDDTLQMLNLINRNAERLLHLINQLMDFRKVEKGRMALHVSKADIIPFLENITLSFQELAQQRHISLTTDYHHKSAEVWFDHEKLENILYNLISNAFKYTPGEGKIWIKLRFFNEEPVDDNAEVSLVESSPWMQIEVGDTGMGIPEEKLSLIFKRFYRVENKNNIQGSGIGLALTKELVKTHHGTIAVKSSPDTGSVFYVNLPCTEISYASEELSDELYRTTNIERKVNLLKYELLSYAPVTHSLATIRHKDSPLILIAEDNNDLREFIVSCLNKTYNIIETDNGHTAGEMAVEYNPDLIISDIIMPRVDGIQLCQQIKENLATSHIPLILLTSKGAVDSRIKGYQAGADEYIAKPFSIELLETRIVNLIDSRKKLREAFQASFKPDIGAITSNPTDHKFLNKAIEIVEKNMENSEFGVSEFAGNMSVSRTLLHKKLTSLTNQSASDFINAIRLKKSRELMMSGEYNISEVAYAVGYNDPKYYSRIFRKYFGLSPSDYIKESRVKAS